MKKIFLFFLLTSFLKNHYGQNVGIGTSSPQFKLDVNGRMRIMSGADINNTAGLWLNDIANSATPAFIGMQNNEQVGFYGNTSGWSFVMNTNTGNVGLGTTAPGFPLNFASTVGDKISLFGNSGAHYGFGIQGSLLQIHSAGIGDDIAFGFGSSIAFTESMRIKGNGNVAIGTSTPAASAQLDVSSTTKGFLPPRMDSTQRNAIVSPATGLTIYNTTLKSVQVYNGTVWYSTAHYIGESYGGGIVFYVYDNGQHGLIAATADQSTGIRWFGGSYTNTRARGDGIGAGLKNTAIIIVNQGPVDGVAFAATVCNEYSVTVGGVNYGDWYLPSKHELNLLYLNKAVVGGFASNDYWSSMESSANFVWLQNFSSGYQYLNFKYLANYVRAVRAF
jgi:hypothetical protein